MAGFPGREARIGDEIRYWAICTANEFAVLNPT
jgi:hypothetical protein